VAGRSEKAAGSLVPSTLSPESRCRRASLSSVTVSPCRRVAVATLRCRRCRRVPCRPSPCLGGRGAAALGAAGLWVGSVACRPDAQEDARSMCDEGGRCSGKPSGSLPEAFRKAKEGAAKGKGRHRKRKRTRRTRRRKEGEGRRRTRRRTRRRKARAGVDLPWSSDASRVHLPGSRAGQGRWTKGGGPRRHDPGRWRRRRSKAE